MNDFHKGLFASFLLSLAIAVFLFYPALSDFGKTAQGLEDIKFFIWLYWHYSESFDNGTDPFFAAEIFYPEGIYLTRTTMMPLLALASFVLPQSLGAIGTMTLFQVISIVLGGIASFAFCYRVSKSFLPSLIGMMVYDFSVYHLQTVLNHINYAMAISLMPLFFIVYSDIVDGKKGKGSLILLSAVLLLITLSEISVSLMLGLIILADVLRKYWERKKAGLDRKKAFILISAGIIAMVSSIALYALSLNELAHVAPPLFFLSAVLIFIVGKDVFAESEGRFGHLRDIALAGIPSAMVLLAIALLPGYEYFQESPILNNAAYAVPLEYLVIPSDFQLAGGLVPGGGLPSSSPTPVHIGLGVSLILAFLLLDKEKGGESKRYFGLFFASLLFSFPVMMVGDQIIAVTPFAPQAMFPFLAVLRVPSRFMVFALLFASVLVALGARTILKHGGKGRAAILLLGLLIVAERIPDYSSTVFKTEIPEIYETLSSSVADDKIFIHPYPALNYYTGLDEIYFQTIHGKKLSYGIVSRPPLPETDLRAIYWNQMSQDRIISFIRETGYSYVVVQKKTCSLPSGCFHAEFEPVDKDALEKTERALEAAFGKPVYEDEARIFYKSG